MGPYLVEGRQFHRVQTIPEVLVKVRGIEPREVVHAKVVNQACRRRILATASAAAAAAAATDRLGSLLLLALQLQHSRRLGGEDLVHDMLQGLAALVGDDVVALAGDMDGVEVGDEDAQVLLDAGVRDGGGAGVELQQFEGQHGGGGQAVQHDDPRQAGARGQQGAAHVAGLDDGREDLVRQLDQLGGAVLQPPHQHALQHEDVVRAVQVLAQRLEAALRAAGRQPHWRLGRMLQPGRRRLVQRGALVDQPLRLLAQLVLRRAQAQLQHVLAQQGRAHPEPLARREPVARRAFLRVPPRAVQLGTRLGERVALERQFVGLQVQRHRHVAVALGDARRPPHERRQRLVEIVRQRDPAPPHLSQPEAFVRVFLDRVQPAGKDGVGEVAQLAPDGVVRVAERLARVRGVFDHEPEAQVGRVRRVVAERHTRVAGLQQAQQQPLFVRLQVPVEVQHLLAAVQHEQAESAGREEHPDRLPAQVGPGVVADEVAVAHVLGHLQRSVRVGVQHVDGFL